jgi:hypothetical protein
MLEMPIDNGTPAWAQTFESEEARNAVEFDPGPEGQRGSIVPRGEPTPPQTLKGDERGFTPKPDWKPVEFAWDASKETNPTGDHNKTDPDKPTVFEDTQGNRFYSPNSTMWDIGFREGGRRDPITGQITIPQDIYRQGVYSGLGGSADQSLVTIQTDTGELIHITRAEALKLDTLKGEDKFAELEAMGIVTPGSMFIPGREKEGQSWSYIKPEGLQAMGEEEKQLFEFRKSLKDQPAELREAYSKGGVPAYNKAVIVYQERIDKELAQFDKDNITLGNKYMLRSDFEKLKPEYQQIAWERGFDVMEDVIRQDDVKQDRALNSLKFAENKDGSYDFDKLASYARTHQNSQQTFKDAGFEDSDKLNQDIKKYNDVSLKLDEKEYIRRYFMDNDLKGIERIPKIAAITIQPFQTIPLTGNKEDKQIILNYNKARSAFIKEHGIGQEIASIELTHAESVFPPARALRPDVELKDISGLEWGIGVAQVALFAIPGVGGGIGKIAGSTAGRLTGAGMGVAAGGVFTCDTVKNWNNMSSTEQKIAVAMDILIIGGGVAGAAGRPNLSPLTGKAKDVITSNINKIASERGGSVKIKPTLKEVSKALSDGDIQALRRAGEKLQQQGRALDSKVIESKGKLLVDKAAEIVRISEKRLTAKQSSDLTERLGNNMDFIKSPSQKVIADFQKIESDIAKTRKQIQSNESLIKKADIELESKPNPKIKKSSLTKAEIEAEKVRLTQQISRDNAQYAELANKGGEPADLHRIMTRMNEARAELAKLEVTPETIGTGKLKLAAQDEIIRLNRKLAEQVKQRNELLASDKATKLWGTKLAGQEPRTPLERERLSPKEDKGTRGGATTLEKVERKVEVKPKTEVKEKIKQVDPDIDKLRKAKEKLAEQTKTKTSPKSKPRTATDTGEIVTIPRVKGTPYIALVWENGRVFAKEIQPTELKQGFIRTSSQGKTSAEIQQRYEELLNTMTKQAALKKLAEEYPNKSNFPVIVSKTSTRTQAEAKSAQSKQNTQIQTKQVTKTAQQIKQEVRAATESPRPVPQPRPKPQFVTKPPPVEPDKIKKRYPLDLKGGGTDKEKREMIMARGGSIGWRQGKSKGKDIWHVIMYPYQSQKDYVLVKGKIPHGAKITVEGPESAYKTAAQFFGKKPSRKLMVDMGIQDVHITPTSEGISLRFKPDPLQETTGDITIGKGKSPFPLQKKSKFPLQKRSPFPLQKRKKGRMTR